MTELEAASRLPFMLKRIKYISRISPTTSRADVDAIAAAAAEKNAQLGITGVLVAGGGFFLQILEGPAEEVDGVFRAICGDDRHQEVLLLGSQDGVPGRLFPDWAMERVYLDPAASAHMETLSAVLSVAFALKLQLDELIGVIERTAWHELVRRVS